MTVFFLAGVGWRKLGNRDSAPRDLNGLAFRGSLEQLIEVSFGVERTHGFHASSISRSKPVDQLVCSYRTATCDHELFDRVTELYPHWVANQSWFMFGFPQP